MSRSWRKVPVLGHGKSDRDAGFRRIGNRCLRHGCRRCLSAADDFDALLLPMAGEVRFTSPWSWPSDGRVWMGAWLASLNVVEAYRALAK